MLLAIDKPTWITSYDIIRIIKPQFPKQKIGHSWTLDPMATGLMILGIGKDTKQLGGLQGLEKTYETVIDFSKISDTRDLDYREFFEEYKLEDLKVPSLEIIKEKLDSLIPECDLPLTPFSAKKKDGKKRYELARKWEQEIEYKPMKVLSYKILDYNFPELNIELQVWSGTYIRSIGYRLGQELGLWWILTQLRRTEIWKFDIDKLEKRTISQHDFRGKDVELRFTEIFTPQ